jgi:N-carbamoylputrescine amidase
MERSTLTVALVRDVFFGEGALARLVARLREARLAGAALAVLPELPLHRWVPSTKAVRDEDAEAPGGPRCEMLREAARCAGVGVLGGAIVRDEHTGQRHNTALVVTAQGHLAASYRKIHLPEEPGFWETSHYAPGDAPPEVIDAFALRLGVQICSDVNRPEGCHLLGALGAEVIAAPRATEAGTFDDWRIVLRANARTSTAYVLSVPRPAPEEGVPLGGPSIAIGPDGAVLVETTEPVAVVTLDRARVEDARHGYPGYLAVAAPVYARGWSKVKSGGSTR